MHGSTGFRYDVCDMRTRGLAASPGHAFRIHIGQAALTPIQIGWEDGRMLPTLLFHEGHLRERI